MEAYELSSIRKLIGIGASALALCVIGVVVASTSAVAHESGASPRESASARTVVAAEPAPSAACVAARQAIATARADDRTEDMSEKLAASDPSANAGKDVGEDQSEKTALMALWVKARSACADQPKTKPPSATGAAPACVAAKQALKTALANERAHELSEKGTTTEFSAADRQEDQAEFAAIKSLWTTAVTDCGFNFFRK